MVNQEVTEARSPRLDGVGGQLCYAAISFGLVAGAKRVLVETANHTKKYWTRYWPGGCDLWRMEKPQFAAESPAALLRTSDWTPEFNPNDEQPTRESRLAAAVDSPAFDASHRSGYFRLYIYIVP